MADWEANWDRGALERIVVLLLALANLANLAAGAPFRRRRQVLGIVSHGEAEARAFVIGMASGEPVSADELETTDNAAHLAVRLRALALMLCLMLTQAGRFMLSGASDPQADRSQRRISGPTVRRHGTAPPASDTS